MLSSVEVVGGRFVPDRPGGGVPRSFVLFFRFIRLPEQRSRLLCVPDGRNVVAVATQHVAARLTGCSAIRTLGFAGALGRECRFGSDASGSRRESLVARTRLG